MFSSTQNAQQRLQQSFSGSLPVATLVITFVLVISTCAWRADAAIAEHVVDSLPDFGPLDSRMYAGSIDMSNPDYSVFYAFVESGHNPRTAPLIVWLNGGPGCSSLLGLFTEIGPRLLFHGGEFGNNTESWSLLGNLLFIEGPPGVGFSRDRSQPPTVWDDAKTAAVNYEFLRKWLDAFPEFKGDGRRLFITGESYAGHYVPTLATAILNGPDAALRQMMSGLAVGNPCTGAPDGSGLDWCFTEEDPTLDEYLRTHAFASLDKSIETNWTGLVWDPYNIVERTCNWLIEQEVVRWNHPLLRERRRARLAMQDTDSVGLDRGLFGLYEPRRVGGGGGGGGAASEPVQPIYGPCNANYLELWLNRAEVKAALHADLDVRWGMCANINYPTPPTMRGVLPEYAKLMEATNWSLLLYSGDADTVVNFIQTQRIIISLNRTIYSGFEPWYHRDVYNWTWRQLGGFFVMYERVSFASVRGAGHMAPTTRGAAMLQLLRSFITTGVPGLAPALVPYNHGPGEPRGDSGCGEVERSREAGLVIGGVIAGSVATAIIMVALRRLLQPQLTAAAMSEEEPVAHSAASYGDIKT